MAPHLIVAELTRRGGRALLGALSLVVGVATFLSLQSYSAAYREAARAPLDQIGADVVAQREGDRPESFDGIVLPHSTSPLTAEDVHSIQSIPGVQAVAGAALFWSFQEEALLVALGVDPAVPVGPARLGAGVTEGRFLQTGETGAAVVDASYAAERNLTVGDSVQVAGERFPVIGLVDTARAGAVANANVYLPLSDAQRMVAASDGVSSVHPTTREDVNILFIRADPLRGEQVADEVSRQLGETALVTTPQSLSGLVGATFAAVDRFGIAIGAVALLIAVLGLLRAVQANLLERRRDMAVLRAVGWTRASLRRQLIGETVSLSAVGLVGGIAVAAGITALLSLITVSIPIPWEVSPTPHFVPGGAEGLSVQVTLDAALTPTALLVVVVITAVVALGCGYLAARRAATIKPAEALHAQ